MAKPTDIGVIECPAAKPLAAVPSHPASVVRTPRAKPFDGYKGQFSPEGLAGIVLAALSASAVIWLALTLIDAWSKV